LFKLLHQTLFGIRTRVRLRSRTIYPIVKHFNPWFQQRFCSLDPIIHLFEPKVSYSLLEIGTRYGESAYKFLMNNSKNQYIGIDPYESYDDYHQDGFDKFLKKSSDKIYKRTSKKLHNKFPGRVRIIRKYSHQASSLIEDESLDFIFVDGNHEYEYVLQDLEKYWPKLKFGGMMCGHDYFMRNSKNGGDYERDMVFEAVRDFAESRQLAVEEFGSFNQHLPVCFAIRKNDNK
jgi:predicted O-methyltransferase YrrM